MSLNAITEMRFIWTKLRRLIQRNSRIEASARDVILKVY
jgi:hypothetical protein